MTIIMNTFIMSIGALLLGGMIASFIFMHFRFKHWKNQNIPFIEPYFPFGTAKSVFTGDESITAMYNRIYFQYDFVPYIGTFYLTSPIIVIRDLNLIGNILIRDFKYFQGRGLSYDEKNDPLSAHLFNLEGEKWKIIRSKLSPTFSSGKMKMMFTSMKQCAIQLIEFIQTNVDNQQGVFEAKEMATRFTTDVIALCAFGINCNCLKDPNAEFRKYGKQIFAPSLRARINEKLLFLPPFLMKMLKVKSHDPEASDFFINTVKETIKERESNLIQRNDFLQLLIELRKENKNKDAVLTPDEAAAQAFLFYIAGFETSSTVISFALYELIVNKKIQEKVIEEVDTIMKKHGGEINYDGVHEAKYLDQVINETLRKYPTVPIMTRCCNADYQISGTNHIIKKGNSVIIPVQSLHHDPNYFPDPDNFDPERFNEHPIKQIPRNVYFPFGDGPRVCLGMRFGMMQAKLGLMMLLASYKFEKSYRTELPIKLNPMTFFPTPINGNWLKAARRDKLTYNKL